MIDILDRVRNKELQEKIVTAEEAAAFFKEGMNVATSGFTASAYPKAIPLALAERMKKEPFTINLWTGASTGPELDEALAKVHGIKKRLPYQTDKDLRNEINDGSVNYLDLHLSESAQLSRCGYLGKVDVAIVEKTGSRMNFERTLPTTQAAYANEVFSSKYNLGFLGVTEPIAELELEERLVNKVKQFLLELGKGFTYIGNQYVLEYNGKESKVDLLFFHRGLHCLVAMDLKIGEFKPEYAGKMNYYLSLLDRLERREDENRSIGIILCAEKDNIEVELALEDMGKPIGVADYQLIIPKDELQKVINDEIESYENDKRLEKESD